MKNFNYQFSIINYFSYLCRLICGKMIIIGIETSTRVCSAALMKDGQTLRQEISLDSGNHAGLLPVYIETLLAYAHENNLHIDAVALSEGPGSYTGLRIGLSTAKGLCYGLDVPLVVVPTTEVLCAAVMAKGENLEQILLCPMIDARRMEVYTALYSCCGRTLHAETDIQALIVDSSEALPDRPMVYFGDGAEKCQSVLENEHRHYLAGIVPEAQYISPRGKWLRTKEEIAYYEPFYLKDFVAAPSHVKGLK